MNKFGGAKFKILANMYSILCTSHGTQIVIKYILTDYLKYENARKKQFYQKTSSKS